MAIDPLLLHHLQTIERKVDKIEEHVQLTINVLEIRIGSLEASRTRQSGVMLGGGAVVTFLAGCAAWIVDKLWSGT